MTVAVSGTGTIEPIQSCCCDHAGHGEILEAPLRRGQRSSTRATCSSAHRRQRRGEQTSSSSSSTSSPPNWPLKRPAGRPRATIRRDRNVKHDAGVITELHVDRGDSVTVGTVIAALTGSHEAEGAFHSADVGPLCGSGRTVTVERHRRAVSGTVESIAATDEVGPGGTLVRQVTILVNNSWVSCLKFSQEPPPWEWVPAPGSSFTALSSQIDVPRPPAIRTCHCRARVTGPWAR